MNHSVIAYARPHASSEADMRCSSLFGTRQCSRLLGRIYQGSDCDLGVFCSRCKVHYRVHVLFEVDERPKLSILGTWRQGEAPTLSRVG